MKFLCVAGSYEKSIYGVDLSVVKKNDASASADGGSNLDYNITSTVAFALAAHTGVIKCVASCEKFLATGSTDETIRIFDLRRRKDYGTINLHLGTITALSFYQNDFLLSASDDGFICISRCSDWECLQKLRAHKHGVTALGLHPSGKIVLSAGKDQKLKLWDLAKGKLAHSQTSSFVIDGIAWSPDGSLYAIFNSSNLSIFKASSSCPVFTQTAPFTKLLVISFLGNDKLILAGEGSRISIIHLETLTEEFFELNQRPRIRSITVSYLSPSPLIFTSSSDGLIHIWNSEFASPLHTLKSGIRITCHTCTK